MLFKVYCLSYAFSSWRSRALFVPHSKWSQQPSVSVFTLLTALGHVCLCEQLVTTGYHFFPIKSR